MPGRISNHPGGLRVRQRANPIRRMLGEIGSILRAQTGIVLSGPFSPYTLDTTSVNYALARELYRNTNDKYKLGAGFAKPIINATSGFMGLPRFTHLGEDDSLDAAIGAWQEQNVGKMLRVNRNALRDGDVWVRLSYLPNRFTPSREKSLKLDLVPPERVSWKSNILTGLFESVSIIHPQRAEIGGRTVDFTITETVTANTIRLEADTNTPAEIKREIDTTVSNPFGFIPFVHFKNEAEEDEMYGFSDLEPVEPFLKAYHDNMMDGRSASRLHGRPKVKIKVEDVAKWKKNNMTAEEVQANAVALQGKEIIFLEGENDDVSIIAPESGIEGIMHLSKYLFFCIVDVSETPEFAFGTAVASSKASVSEQMIPFAAKITRKRGQSEEYWNEFGEMLAASISRVESIPVATYGVKGEWDEVNVRSDRDVAETIARLADGLIAAVEGNLCSLEAASEFLRQFVPTMLPYVDPDAPVDQTELGRILESAKQRRELADLAMGTPELAGDEEDEDDTQVVPLNGRTAIAAR